MLENIYRHVEDGMAPMEAAFKGAGEIGFTIISISVSLVAVFIPLLLMGGIVGRLFREFAVTVTLTIAVSVMISLTLTPMLCSRFLKNEHDASHGRLYQLFERGFDAMLDGYKRGLRRRAAATSSSPCASSSLTLAATVLLFIVIPKGFFPQQDTGFIFGSAQGAQDSSFESMNRRMIAARRRRAPGSGRDRRGDVRQLVAVQRRQLLHRAEAQGRRPQARAPTRSSRGCGRSSRRCEGASLLMQAGQDINVGGRLARTQYQYTLTDANLDELNEWAPQLLARMQRAAAAHRRRLRHPERGDDRVADDRPRPRLELRHLAAAIDATIYDAIGQRQVSQYFTQINSYHVVLEVTPALQARPVAVQQALHHLAAHRPAGAAVDAASRSTRPRPPT